MANLTSTTITGTLNTTSTITGPASGASALNASNVSSGTLASDRLPTVPTTKGGTGLTSIGSAGQVLKVAAPGSALEFGDAGGGGDYVQRIYTSPATWTKPAGLKAVKVKVWGGGGAGGRGLRVSPSATRIGGAGGAGGFSEEYLPEASIPGPVSVTAGPGTNSYGAFLSATGGGNGNDGTNPTPGTNGTPGTGSGGQLNFPGEWYMREPNRTPDTTAVVTTGTYGFGVRGKTGLIAPGINPGQAGSGYQMGGGGGGSPNPANPLAALGGAGAPGAVIIEEYY
jgi:hypothetical protein